MLHTGRTHSRFLESKLTPTNLRLCLLTGRFSARGRRTISPYIILLVAWVRLLFWGPPKLVLFLLVSISKPQQKGHPQKRQTRMRFCLWRLPSPFSPKSKCPRLPMFTFIVKHFVQVHYCYACAHCLKDVLPMQTF